MQNDVGTANQGILSCNDMALQPRPTCIILGLILRVVGSQEINEPCGCYGFIVD